MNFRNHENGEKLAFSWIFHFYPILDYYKIRTTINFGNPNGKSLDLHLTMWFMPKEMFPGLNRFYRGHFQNTQNIKTFFGYAQCMKILNHIRCIRKNASLRPVLIVVQVMSDTSKQDCIHWYITSVYLSVRKWEFAFIINNSDNVQKSRTDSYNSWGRL